MVLFIWMCTVNNTFAGASLNAIPLIGVRYVCMTKSGKRTIPWRHST